MLVNGPYLQHLACWARGVAISVRRGPGTARALRAASRDNTFNIDGVYETTIITKRASGVNVSNESGSHFPNLVQNQFMADLARVGGVFKRDW